MNKQKRILSIHDISGVGKCSLTVALPIISLFGHEASAMPTAILSTHTGGFTDFTYRDLTDDLLGMTNHWKNIDLAIDGVYTGYLGSIKQVDIIIETIDTLKKEHTTIIVDPVMADNGKLYPSFPENFPQEMTRLCKKADFIIPNITEATLMLGEEYKDGPYTKEYIENILRKFDSFGAKFVILTGVHFDNDQLGVACYNVEENKIDYVFDKKLDGYFHGTGDVFGSYLTGALIDGKNPVEACGVAVKYTVEAIKNTIEADTIPKYGVNFEKSTPKFVKDYYSL